MFKKEIKIGQIFTKQKTIEPHETAKHLGSGSVEVLSTPAMIAFMENTALQIDEFLQENFATVGIEICVKHVKAARVGEKITGFAKLTEIDGKKLTFYVEVLSENEKIGFGTHKRYIIDKQKFGS